MLASSVGELWDTVSLCHSSHWCRWHCCVGCVDDAGVDDVDYIDDVVDVVDVGLILVGRL